MDGTESVESIKSLATLDPIVTLLNIAAGESRLHSSRRVFDVLKTSNIETPVVHHRVYEEGAVRDEIVITTGSEVGGLLCDGMGDGLLLEVPSEDIEYLRNTSFGLLQVPLVTFSCLLASYCLPPSATGSCMCVQYGLPGKARYQYTLSNNFCVQGSRMRNVKTEYVSCPSCGRTLFDLQEVTAQISTQTGHLPGVTIAVMGCIVNGPGEMADADFGYVGGAPGKIDLYVGKEVVRRGIPMEGACDELIGLIKEYDRWVEKEDDAEEVEAAAVAA